MKLITIALLVLLTTGCASNRSFESFQSVELSQPQAQQITTDALSRIEANYAPAKTVIDLQQTKGLFGLELENQLRERGYGIEIPKTSKNGSEKTPVNSSATKIRYEVKAYGPDNVLLVVQGADGFQINRVYKKETNEGALTPLTGISEIKASNNE